jgi:competence protein ComFC
MTKINPQKIAGKWKSGVALDVHTLSSVYLGVNEHGHEVYDTTRSEIGELLYRLKYRGDMAAAKDIVAAVSTYLKPHLQKFDQGHRHHHEVACRRMRHAYPFRDGIEGCH